MEQEILSMVGTVGFPIVMCLLLYYRDNKRDEQHRAEVEKLATAVQNNTLVMQKILDKLGVDING